MHMVFLWLRWRWADVLAKPFVTSVIIGAKGLDQLKENLAASELVLSAEEMKKLDEVSALPAGVSGVDGASPEHQPPGGHSACLVWFWDDLTGPAMSGIGRPWPSRCGGSGKCRAWCVARWVRGVSRRRTEVWSAG